MIKIIADIFALGGAVLGSVFVASNMGIAVHGYLLFLTSSLASVYLLLTTKNAPRSLVLQNIFFIGVNIFGIIRHMA
jgi:hypothetical protein